MRMSRYGKFMMLNNTRSPSNTMRGDESGVRNAYVVRNEYRGDYNAGEARFRDNRGRERYDNGRYAPRNDMENNGGYGQPRGDSGGYGDSAPRGMGDYSGGNARMEGRMNTIGFERPQEARSDYGMNAHYGHEKGKGEKMHGGAYSMGFTQETAKEWVKKMQNEDGSTGEHWSMEQIKKLAAQRGVDKEPYELYAVMNSLHSDFGKVLKKHGVTAPEAYLELAEAWLDDKDAVKDKLAVYYECIVKH